PDASYEDVVTHPAVIACLKQGLHAHNASTTGSSMRIARAMLMVEPPSIDGNELTDKGYINQRAGLERRAALVEKLYADHPGEDVIVLQRGSRPLTSSFRDAPLGAGLRCAIAHR